MLRLVGPFTNDLGDIDIAILIAEIFIKIVAGEVTFNIASFGAGVSINLVDNAVAKCDEECVHNMVCGLGEVDACFSEFDPVATFVVKGRGQFLFDERSEDCSVRWGVTQNLVIPTAVGHVHSFGDSFEAACLFLC